MNTQATLQRPKATEDLYTSGTYLQSNPDWHAGEASWKAAAIVHMLRCHGLIPETIADVGCGSGDVLALLAGELSETATFAGYDIAPMAIKLARPKAHNRLRFVLGEFPHGSLVDLLLVLDVIEHVENPWEWLREIHGGGTYTIFHLPLDLTVHRVLRSNALLGIRRKYGHLHYFNRMVALRVLEESGFEVIDWMYTEEFREGTPSNPALRALAWTRKVLYGIAPEMSVRLIGGCRLLVLAR